MVVYVLWDRRGGVEDYVLYALADIRLIAHHVLVVVNGTLDESARDRLEAVSDEILVRPNVGFDIGAHRDALVYLGDRVSQFDEIVQTNDTWFGPISSFTGVIERMNSESVDFWGMTDHAEERPNPFDGSDVLNYHLQSFWLATRRPMFESQAWRSYWLQLPELPGYFDAVLKHEVVFTLHFADQGYTPGVAYGVAKYPSVHPALFHADLLIADGCPLVKRRPFFHYPPFLDRHAVIGRKLAAEMERRGYPLELMWRNLAQNVEPKVLHTNAAMLEVLPDAGISVARPSAFSILVVLHIFYTDMAEEMLDLVERLPGGFDLIITTPDHRGAGELRRIMADRRPRGSVEIREVESNDGRDQSAFLIGCRRELTDGSYDLVVKLHSKKTPQDGVNVGNHFKEQQFSNLFRSEGYVANVLDLFQRESGLGIVYAPMIHVGYPTIGRAWWANRRRVVELCEDLNVRVPVDHASPLAPFGSMYIARPEALLLLTEHPWRYADFGGSEAYRDGGLAHALERMPSYVAAERGYHTRTVAHAEYIAISHTAMEFKYDQLASVIPGDALEQIEFVRSVRPVVGVRLLDFARAYLDVRWPRSRRVLTRIAGRRALLGRLIRSMLRGIR